MFAACGGRVVQGDGGTDGLASESGVDGAGWTECSSPSGYQLCGGSANCDLGCGFCANILVSIGFCGDNGVPDPFTNTNCAVVPDGSVCLVVGSLPDGGTGNDRLMGSSIAWEAGELIYRAGYGDSVLFADATPFDGTPLPQPPDCPSISGLTLCGGACGDTCPHDDAHACMGRSPKHPYSLCVDVAPLSWNGTPDPHCARDNPPSDGKHGCLIFRDDPASQPIADSNGVWIDLPTCQAAAAGYPGGADCVFQ